MSKDDKPIQRAIAKLLSIKNVVILLIVAAGVYCVAIKEIEAAIISSLFGTVVATALQSKD